MALVIDPSSTMAGQGIVVDDSIRIGEGTKNTLSGGAYIWDVFCGGICRYCCSATINTSRG